MCTFFSLYTQPDVYGSTYRVRIPLDCIYIGAVLEGDTTPTTLHSTHRYRVATSAAAIGGEYAG